MIRICGPKDKPRNLKDGNIMINCCSTSSTWNRGLSLFLCGPVVLTDGSRSENV